MKGGWLGGLSGRIRALMACGVAMCLVALLCFGLDRVGRQYRTIEVDEDGIVVAVDAPDGLLRALEPHRVHGASALVALGRRTFGFQTVVFGDQIPVRPGYPFERIDMQRAVLRHITRENLYWVAHATGRLRAVDYLYPASDFATLVAEGRAQGRQGISADGDRIRPNIDGVVRTIAPRPSRDSYDVVIVEASYFEHGTPEALAGALRSLEPPPRLVVLDRSVDDTATSGDARARLATFARLLGAVK